MTEAMLVLDRNGTEIRIGEAAISPHGSICVITGMHGAHAVYGLTPTMATIGAASKYAMISAETMRAIWK